MRQEKEDSRKTSPPAEGRDTGPSLSLWPPPVMAVVKAEPLPVARHSFHYNSLYINSEATTHVSDVNPCCHQALPAHCTQPALHVVCVNLAAAGTHPSPPNPAATAHCLHDLRG